MLLAHSPIMIVMNVLIVGATGFVGSAVDEALKANGHRTFGVARSDSAREKLEKRGTTVVLGDAARPQTLAKAISSADAVVYAVNVTDADPWTVDNNALRQIRKSLAGSEKTFVFVSCAWIYGSTGDVPVGEAAPISPPALLIRRLELERLTIDMTRVGIRALIVRGGIAYGNGGGIPSMFVQSARERGAATIVGDGRNRWATIDVHDLGRCIARAVETGRFQSGQKIGKIDDAPARRGERPVGGAILGVRHGDRPGVAAAGHCSPRFQSCCGCCHCSCQAGSTPVKTDWLHCWPSLCAQLSIWCRT